ncbi:MAG: lipid-A-disaccharide synthase [Gammaproteobacteria bacterium]|nr:lipid-A-disaccharide synthase [Gammaproteobacteria bacterium]
MAARHVALRVGIVAGETSGDILGARLMRAIRCRVDGVEFSGIGGDQMLAEGLQSRAALSRLSVNGFVEPLKRLPDLLRVLKDLVRHFSESAVDVVVGVDFNVFNLLAERLVKRRSIPTAHYVSPSVYAWRRGRVKRIGRAADVVMALFPFEPELYRDHGVRAVFVGHPLADDIAPGAGCDAARQAARSRLGLETDAIVVALMPGSRMSEIEAMGEVFMATAARLQLELGRCAFIVPCPDPGIRDRLRKMVCGRSAELDVRLTTGNSVEAMTAADGVLVKSGTGTLEAMLLRRPMVVTYRLGALTYRVVKALKSSEFVALPNILSGRRLVPELLQDAAEPDGLARALLGEMRRARDDPGYFCEFDRQHAILRRGASDRAAEAVLSLVDSR